MRPWNNFPMWIVLTPYPYSIAIVIRPSGRKNCDEKWRGGHQPRLRSGQDTGGEDRRCVKCGILEDSREAA